MGVILHPEHGVNPTMTQCFYCGKDKDILLIGKPKPEMYKQGLCDASGKMKMSIGVVDMEPCNECRDYMEQGIILISAKDEDLGTKDPYRTGGWVVIKEEGFKEMINDPELLENVLKKRFCFVSDKVWDNLGLPRE